MILTDSPVVMVSETFRKNANVQSYDLFEEAARDREAFWANQAQCLDWFSPWESILEWNPPFAKWFVGGKLNACYNCLDRHMQGAMAQKTALIWEGERGEERSLSYEELFQEVCKFSNVLKNLGIQKGDKVAIYLPMIPEAVVAMLSCARIGAVHTVVFGGFSADSLKDRIIDANAKLLITADGGFRKGKVIPLKETADSALEGCPSIQNVVVVRRTHLHVPMCSRDHWYDQLMKNVPAESPAEAMDAEDELYILYTSGTTGKPKGIVHTTGGYMVGVTMTTRWVFDIKPSDIYWCTADVGWVTGHSYVVYGPLSNGMTQLLYEGSPDFPERDRFWKLIEKYGVTILYTAPTAIRTFMKWGEEWPKSCNLSSLRLLGSVGEPINPEAWMWYYQHIGGGNCPVVDTWWQTETGSIMIAPLPGLTPLKPGSATHPLPGIETSILESGYLVINSPWPSMLRGIHGDQDRFRETYWKNGIYFTGDGAKRDADGYFWLAGRVDDVINVSGHRLGTMEIESALVDYQAVAEAAVIAISHPITGQAIVAFVTLKEKIYPNNLKNREFDKEAAQILESGASGIVREQGASEDPKFVAKPTLSQTDSSSYLGIKPGPELEQQLKAHVVKKIGAIARPERIIFIYDLPKTRSGKIMRRLLRDIAEGRVVGDTTTLSDPSVIAEVKHRFGEDDR